MLFKLIDKRKSLVVYNISLAKLDQQIHVLLKMLFRVYLLNSWNLSWMIVTVKRMKIVLMSQDEGWLPSYVQQIKINKIDNDSQLTMSIRLMTAKIRVVKHVRLHWNSWRWNYCGTYKFMKTLKFLQMPQWGLVVKWNIAVSVVRDFILIVLK